MRILITNDDGIEAPGLRALEHIAGEVSKDVWVVAPETNNSGASHSLTLAEPLRMRKLSERHYAVKGTPTDCVIILAVIQAPARNWSHLRQPGGIKIEAGE